MYFDEALYHFKVADNLIVKSSHNWNAELILKVKLHIAECEYITNDFEKALALLNHLENEFSEDDMQIEIILQKAYLFTFWRQYEISQSVTLKGLALIGVNLPAHPNTIELNDQALLTFAALQSCSIENIANLPEMNDKKKLKELALLTALMISTLHINPNLFNLLLMKILCLTLQYGSSEFSPIAVSGYSILCQTTLRNPLFINDSLMLLNQSTKCYKNTSLNCIAYFLIGAFRLQSFSENVQALEYSIKYGLESGNIFFTSYAMMSKIQLTHFSGEPLDTILKQCESYQSFAIKYKIAILSNTLELIKHHITYLKSGHILDLQALSSKSALANGFEVSYYLHKAEGYYLTSLYREAESMTAIGRLHINDKVLSYRVLEFYFYEGLILAKIYDQKTFCEQEKIMNRLSDILNIYKDLNENTDPCFNGKRYLLLGEWHALHHQYKESLKYFQEALLVFESCSNYHYKAITYNLIGAASKKMCLNHETTLAFKEAALYYVQWGSPLSIHKHLLQDHTSKTNTLSYVKTKKDFICINQSIPLTHIDFFHSTVIEETHSFKSISSFFEIVERHYNPDRIALLIPYQDKFHLIASKSNKNISIFSEFQLISTSKYYPLKLFKVSNRCKQPMFYDHMALSIFIKDAFFENNQIHFGYCFPIIKGEHTQALVYFEFNQAETRLFKSDLEYLKCLITPLAYSVFLNQALYKINSATQKSNLSLLSKRELEILKYVVKGQTNKEISHTIYVSENTIKTHLKSIFRKLEVTRRAQLIHLIKDYDLEDQ